MKYALLIYSNEARDTFDGLPEAEQQAIMGEYFAISESPGVTGGAQLQPVDTATTVRVQDGRTLTTDGPFVETKEKVGGLFIIEARDLNEAIRIASLHPAAHLGEGQGWAIEVRPIADGCHQ